MYINEVPTELKSFPATLSLSSRLWAGKLIQPVVEDIVSALSNPYSVAINKIAKDRENSFAMLYKHGDWSEQPASLRQYRTKEASDMKQNVEVQDYWLNFLGIGQNAPRGSMGRLTEIVSYMLGSIATSYAFKYLFRIPWVKQPAELISLDSSFASGFGIFQPNGIIKNHDLLFKALGLAELLVGFAVLPANKVVLKLGQKFLAKIGIHFILSVLQSLILNPLTAGLRKNDGNIASFVVGEVYDAIFDGRSKRNVYSVVHGILARRYETMEELLKNANKLKQYRNVLTADDTNTMLTIMRWVEAYFDGPAKTFPVELREYLEDCEDEATTAKQDWAQIGSESIYLFTSKIISRETSNRIAAAVMAFLYTPIVRYLSAKDGTFQLMTTGWLMADSYDEIDRIMASDMAKKTMTNYQMSEEEFYFANMIDPDTYNDQTPFLERFRKDAYIVGADFWTDIKESFNRFQTAAYEDVLNYLLRGVTDKVKNLKMEVRKFNPFNLAEHKEIIGG